MRKGETFLWYKRNINIPRPWNDKRVLLHFGAVDHFAVVFVNGKKVGTHGGGYEAFHFDITDYLTTRENTVVVGAYDPNDGKVPCGKNGDKGDYTFSSGIWQTVWMEPVEQQHITHLKLIPDLENDRLAITVFSPKKGLKVVANAKEGAKAKASADGQPGETFYLSVENPRLWTPDDPFLYDLNLQLVDAKGKTVDQVDSYFGMRSVRIEKVNGVNRTILNGKFEFQLGLLDQGYWPDGVFTAPTDEALRYDIELAKKTGFNVVRKHIKVEPQRWYHHCDKIGVLVWQDMPNLWYPDEVDSVAVRAQFRSEWKAIMDQLISVPSIIMWVPFNENWGAFEVADITDWTKKYDPTRLVNGLSGYNYAPGYRPAPGDPGNGDFVDLHHYGEMKDKYFPEPDEQRAASLGEFGGKGLFVRGHLWPVPNNAYEVMINSEILTDTYIYLLNEVEQRMLYRGLSAAIYTQTTDVEHEINGLVTYDRKVEKMDFEKVKWINEAILKNGRNMGAKKNISSIVREYPVE
ncbi:glycoside hydrolase family 2 protein [Olivibacter sp. SDN3]|uniref:glycoside hydrolase family 2 protein n=1 Tax=Olivibacter sp. SDN3 TaxID=2764720 RepID=UPI001C9E89F1|nr:sugar-binding domain-containing protein [Olivibacter sp. SDN3]